MNSLTASLPQHLYGLVRREFVTNNSESGFDKCIIHAVSCKPAQALTFSVLLENGAQYRGIPIHGLVIGQDPEKEIPVIKELNVHQVWGCFGTEFSIVNMSYLKGIPCQWYTGEGMTINGRGLGWAIEFDGDGYSNAPQQDKSFNMLLSDEGYLAAMPNNRVRWFDNSFTNWELPITLKVNHKLFYPECLYEYPEHTALVKEDEM